MASKINTELKDKNGKTIAEGDKLHVWNEEKDEKYRDYEGMVIKNDLDVLCIRYEGYGQVVDTPITEYPENYREIVDAKPEK